MSSLRVLIGELVQKAAGEGVDQLAVGAAIIANGKLLLVTRADEEDIFPNHVELPGGSVDPGEDLLQAVARELMEETGLIAKTISEYLGSFDYLLSDGRKVRQFNFLIEPESDDVHLNPLEHSSLHWLDPGDVAYLDSILITPLMKECVQGVCSRIGAR